jgi:serine phosphatase RsbU (regulator of sigma subunit)/GAF domain-containing protein
VTDLLVPLMSITNPAELAAARTRAGRGAAKVAPELAETAELVASELLTNSLLHGGGVATLAVERRGGDRVRIAVRDGEPRSPLVGISSESSMTGRGLRMVSALSAGWGVTPLADGKEVWAELVTGHQPAVDALGLFQDDDGVGADPDERAGDGARRFRVVLGDVPTDLLLRAKSHIDNLVREFKLASSDVSLLGTAPSPDVSAHLSELIDTVVHRFVDAREGIKRQAIAAHEAGLDHTRLELHLTAEAAEAGEAYLLALDEVDAYCRAMRLLTLETPPEQRVFRQWYVEEIIGQVRAAAAGADPPPSMSFEERLLEEIASVAAAQRSSQRAARLYDVSVALTAAASAEDVAGVVLRQGVVALGASGAGVLLAGDRDRLRVTGTVGYDEAIVERLRHESPDAELPAAFALRTGEAVWLESPEERDRRFPALHGMEQDTVSMCAVPLVIAGRAEGALRFSFAGARLFDADERRFVLALAAQCAQALHRVRLEEQEQEDRFRLAIESMLDPVMMCRPERDETGRVVDLRVEYVNAAARDPQSHALGSRLSELWTGIREQGLLAQYLAVAEDGEPLVLDAYRYDDPFGRPETGGVFDLRATRIGDLVFIVYRNVTDRVERADETLRHQESLAEAQRIANIGSWSWDATSGRTQWSDHFYEICGLDRERPPSRRRFLELLDDEAVAQLRRAMAEAAATGTAFELEVRLTRPDGDVRDVVITGEAAAEGAGGLDDLVLTRGTIQDVTDRRFVELALRRSEERLRQEHEAVKILQAAILPTELPEVPGATVLARYLAASEDVGVGGDFYDVFILADGRVVLTVGDVAGKGIEAAEAVGQLRNSLRMAAVIDPDPEVVVPRLNELIAHGFSAPFATAAIGLYDPGTGAFTWCSAGHLPLLVRGRDGAVRFEGDLPTHLPLGVADVRLRAPHRVTIEPGETVMLFSDGLVERRGEDLDVGLARLAESVAAAPDDLDGVTVAVLDANVGSEARRDDVCLLLLRRSAETA